jgi:hypothetical protein
VTLAFPVPSSECLFLNIFGFAISDHRNWGRRPDLRMGTYTLVLI